MLNNALRSQVRQKMNSLKNICRDASTGEVNHVHLAELAAQELQLYIENTDYDIPEEIFDIAAEFS